MEFTSIMAAAHCLIDLFFGILIFGTSLNISFDEFLQSGLKVMSIDVQSARTTPVAS